MSFIDKIASAKKEVRESITETVKPPKTSSLNKENESEISISDIAAETIALLEIPEFKKLMALENRIISMHASKPYELHGFEANTNYTYGEKQMFTRGFLNGIAHIKLRREQMWNDYINKIQQEKEEKNADKND